MRTAMAHLRSITPYSQSKAFVSTKDRDETHDEFDTRVWRERCHANGKGVVFIPPMAFKNCISEAAKYKAIKIPGKGNSTYTKHFEAGVLCNEPLSLGVHLDDVKCERLFVPADGKRGGSKRVFRTFPIFHEWEGVVQFLIFDEIINNDIFEQHLIDAGQFIGIGRFRPRNNGYYGRFEVVKVNWK